MSVVAASNERPSGRLLAVVALTGFVVRLAWLLAEGRYAVGIHDSFGAWVPGFEMGAVARSLAHGRGFSSPFDVTLGDTGPTAWVAPIYPLMVSLVLRVAGDFSRESKFILMALNGLASALTAIPLMLVSARAVGRRGASIAGWGWALYPYFNRWYYWVWDTNVSALLVMGLIWLTVEVADRRRAKWDAGLGLAFGLALLCSSVVGPILPVLAGWVLWKRRTPGHLDLRPLVLMLLATALTLAPWTIRNRLALGEWILLRSNLGAEIYLTNMPGEMPSNWVQRHPSLNWEEGVRYRQEGEVAYSRDSMQQVLQAITASPGHFVRITLFRMEAFWTGEVATFYGEDGYWRWRGYVPLSLLGLIGLAWGAWRRTPLSVLSLALVAAYPLIYYATAPSTRQRHGLEPLLLMWAAFVVEELVVLAARLLPALARIAQSTRAREVMAAGIALEVLASGAWAMQRVSHRGGEPAPREVVTPELFVERCGMPDAEAPNGDLVELDYPGANLRVRIVDRTYALGFSRDTGRFRVAADAMKCWHGLH